MDLFTVILILIIDLNINHSYDYIPLVSFNELEFLKIFKNLCLQVS